MKILFPIDKLYPAQYGGPCNTVYWMAKALVQKGVEVIITTTNIGSEDKVPANQWLDTNYGRVIYYTTRSELFPLRMMRTIVKAIPHCSVIHLTSLYYPHSLLAAVTARWYGKPVIWSPRGELDELALVYSPWKKRPVLWLIRNLLAKNVVFHSTSPEETQRIKTVLGQQMQVVEIPNFLELPTLVEPTTSTPPYLLYVGRIHPIKAIENLISALPHSQQFMASEMKLIIAGNVNNSYGEQLKQQAEYLNLSQKVEFVGHIEGRAKQELYSNAYFFIIPSNTENFGNVVVESLAQGTPVIASTGTPWSILGREQAGFWVENTQTALTAAIDQALNLSPEKYQDYRANALSVAYEQFDVYKNVGKWVEAYQQASFLKMDI